MISVCSADEQPATEDVIAIAQLTLDAPVDFASQVLPILRAKCLACHNTAEAESDLVLENPEAILRGGNEGPAAVAGKPEESLLLLAASHQTEPFMPPPDNDVGAKDLTPEELGLLKLWIEQGVSVGEPSAQPAPQPIVWNSIPDTIQPILASAVTDDARLAACGRGSRLFVYDLSGAVSPQELIDAEIAQARPAAAPAAHLDLVQSIAFSPSGDLIASGGFRTVKLWRKQTGGVLVNIQVGDDVSAMAVSPDGTVLTSGHASGAVHWYRAASGELLRSADIHQGPVTDIGFSADGAVTFTASEDRTARATRTSDGTAISGLLTSAPVTAMARLGEPPLWITGHADAIIRVWAEPASIAVDKPAQLIRELVGHGRAVTALAPIATAPQQLISGSIDGTLRRWDAAAGTALQTFIHADAVADVAVSADSARFASAGADGAVRLWNAEDGKLIAALKGDFRREWAVRSASLGEELLRNELNHFQQAADAARKEGETKAQSLAKADAEKMSAQKAHAEKEQAVAQSSEKKDAAAKAAAGAAEILSKAGEAKAAAEAQFQQITSAVAVIEPQLKTLIDSAATVKDQVDVNPAVEALQAAVAGAKQRRQSLQQDLAGPLAASLASADEQAKSLAAAAEAAAKELEEATKAAKESQSTLEQTVRAAEDAAGEARRAEETLQTAQDRAARLEQEHQTAQKYRSECEAALQASQRPVTSVAFSPSGLLAMGSSSGQVLLFDATSGRAVQVFDGHSGKVVGVGFLPSGGLASAASDGRAVVTGTSSQWGLERAIGRFDDATIFADRVLALAFSPDGSILATGGGEPSRSGQLKLWNAHDGTLLREIPEAHSDTIFALAFSRDGKLLATAGADRMAKVFRVEDGAALKTFEGHTHHVLGICWSANGRWLASSGADNVVKVWNFESGEQLRTIDGFQKEVTAVEFLGIGEQTVAVSGDAAVRLHNVTDGKQVRALDGAGGFLYTAAASGDGRVVAAGGLDSVLRIWNSETGEAIHAFDPPLLKE